MSDELQASFDYCRKLTRQQAANFYFSFLTLPREKRVAMCAIYTWMRLLDDLADDAPSLDHARSALDSWKKQTHLVLEKGEGMGGAPHWPAFAATVSRYGIPQGYFDEIIEGALMDQGVLRYETFDQLYQYCYRVASVVGLVSLRVFGYTNKMVEQQGEWLGIAFQLTNILRDVGEDAGRNRIYLPQEDLQKFGVSEGDILGQKWNPGMRDLMKAFAERAETYYQKASPVFRQVTPDSQATLGIMNKIYHGILEQIQEMDYRVFEGRARVPTWKKLWIVLRFQMGWERVGP